MKHDYTTLFADDDLFYGVVDKIYKNYMTDDKVFTFSFRLGTNINYCYPMSQDNSINKYEQIGNVIKWDWTKEEMDFAYPLSTINHVFRTKQLKKMIEKIKFSDLNVLESELQSFLPEFKEKSPFMMSYHTSKVFGVPANIVNTTHGNKHGLVHPYSVEDLNERLLKGEYIDISKMNYGSVNSAQFEIAYEFNKL